VIGDMAPNLSPRRIQAYESSCVSQHLPEVHGLWYDG
jgi:hypothetical protein